MPMWDKRAYSDVRKLSLDDALDERISLWIDRAGGFVEHEDLAAAHKGPE